MPRARRFAKSGVAPGRRPTGNPRGPVVPRSPKVVASMLSQSQTRPRHRSEVAVPARGRGLVPRGAAFWLVATALAATMLGTTLPTPLYVLYEQRFGLAAFMGTVIFAVYAT